MAASWGELLIGSRPPNTPTTVGATATGAAFDCPGGICVFSASCAGWNGATCGLYILAPDGVTWILASASQTTFTGNNAGWVYLPPCQVQAQISVAVPTQPLFAAIARVVQ